MQGGTGGPTSQLPCGASMARHEDVTVVIPCFNHGRFLLGSVERALGQQGGPPKVIVVDDGSTDQANERALAELPDGVRLIRQQNAGVSAARNAGFENSDSELLLMVDADDRLTLDALDVLRPPLEANPDVGYCYGLMKLIGAWSGVLRFPDFDPYILLHRSIAGAQLGLVRRRCWEDAGGFDPAIDGYEDWDFCLSALERGWRGLQINRVTHEYRKVFTRLDVVLSPVLTHTTPAIGHLSPTLPFEELFPRLQAYVGFTPLNNASGGPAISLPLGATSNGLPIGCQLAADLGDERTLLELAFELEAARPWSRIQDAGAG